MRLDGICAFDKDLRMVFVTPRLISKGFRFSLHDRDGTLNVPRASRTEKIVLH